MAETTICGDFFEQAPPETLLVIADPPYGQVVSDDYDNLDEKQLLTFLYDFVEGCQNFVLEGGSVLMWGGIGSHKNRAFLKFAATVEDEFKEWRLRDFITWKKSRGYGVADRYLFTREEMLWLVRGEKPAIFNKPYLTEQHSEMTQNVLKNKKYKPHSTFKRRSNVWTDVTEVMHQKIVSAQKPTQLYEIILQAHSNPGDLVVDPFAGSFTTAVAARSLGRSFWVCEKDPEVFALGKKRLESSQRMPQLFAHGKVTE